MKVIGALVLVGAAGCFFNQLFVVGFIGLVAGLGLIGSAMKRN